MTEARQHLFVTAASTLLQPALDVLLWRLWNVAIIVKLERELFRLKNLVNLRRQIASVVKVIRLPTDDVSLQFGHFHRTGRN